MATGRRDSRRPRPTGRPARRPTRRDELEGTDPARLSGWLYGRNAVLEALRAGGRVRKVLIARSAHGEPVRQVIAEAESRRVALELVPRERLDALTPHHQGVMAEVRPFAYARFETLLERLRNKGRPPLLLALDGIQDPQNLGALVRSAASAAADGLILPERRAAAVTAAVVKASAGTVERVPIVQVTNLARSLEALKERGVWIVGLSADGKHLPWEVDLRVPVVLVIGGEGSGLGRLVRRHCDLVVRLPMPGQVDSLNAAMAGTAMLYEVLRQRLAGTRQQGH